MKMIKLVCKTKDEELTSIEVDSTSWKLTISEESVVSIDLAPLEELSRLQLLTISNNDSLKSLDLAALTNCPNLRLLKISENDSLEKIDLSACSRMKALDRIDIVENEMLSELDLAPLSKSTSLKTISISDNTNLAELDITPLALCSTVTSILVSGWRGKTDHCTIFDKSTFTKNCSLSVEYMEEFNVPVRYKDLEFIQTLYQVLIQNNEERWKLFHLAQCIPEAVGLKGIGFLDITPNQIETLMHERNPSSIKKRIIELYLKQIDAGSTTIGADVEKLQSGPKSLVLKIPRILKLRQQEMEKVKILADPQKVNLRPLFLTAYGYEVLSVMNMGLRCTKKEFEKVEDSFKRLGFEIPEKGTGEKTYQDSVSASLREYIWQLVKHSQQIKDTMQLRDRLDLMFPD